MPTPAEGSPSETPTPRSAPRQTTRVTYVKDGPILVEGPVEITLEDGTTARSDRFVVALCACRRSKRHPFCDTSHRARRRGADRSGQPAPDDSPRP
ncbi:CDGSH iron-sulfur domain-containing protein [Nonomuraea phyllanthi]|uniref:CDGSH iron-sulfur domain-containing protein n=1 Tax=Nonomuraea phyllanthi TaxID=2219224 RepID=A0A5C4WW34_9ACTN|nr:CDGSH iron-sulfur domain-containing protein [Nonomuraea phyllanthi]QFY15014.1 CDGSH iron-sulfur domain-containing protein [Nonomuraea phyllanthi]